MDSRLGVRTEAYGHPAAVAGHSGAAGAHRLKQRGSRLSRPPTLCQQDLGQAGLLEALGDPNRSMDDRRMAVSWRARVL